ncbi:MAG: phytanoyl-CoA dioxygenase family protein [Planctomycetota bacterium]|nr:phytanoyl-CoA dioxygenase family protein [Planctomycetota bacterium]MDA1139752.1 phytanoyl-CoA dioxygenase family protein [Planctomycetota bacterium]
MALTESQLEQYNKLGYVIIDCPFLLEMTERCLAAVEKVAINPAETGPCRIGNHSRLKPLDPESYWSELDHSLAFMQVILHPEFVDIGRQVTGCRDIFLRNGGINDMAVGLGVQWHRDSNDDSLEFMHYFTGGKCENGCLRVVPGSHLGPADEMLETIRRLREEQGRPAKGRTFEPFEDVALPGEVSLEIEPHQILFRRGSIFHSTHLNTASYSRMMSHWGYLPSHVDDHRFTWDDYLTDELIEALTPEQREVLWLGRDFKIAEAFKAERAREFGKFRWSIV